MTHKVVNRDIKLERKTLGTIAEEGNDVKCSWWISATSHYVQHDTQPVGPSGFTQQLRFVICYLWWSQEVMNPADLGD